jgi:hypothetical protein
MTGKLLLMAKIMMTNNEFEEHIGICTDLALALTDNVSSIYLLKITNKRKY